MPMHDHSPKHRDAASTQAAASACALHHKQRQDVPAVPLMLAAMALASGLLMLAAALAPLFGGVLLGGAFTVVTAAALRLAHLWRRQRQQLHQRDAALDELCRARRQAALAAAERARLMAFVTHELRTPLNGVLGMAGLLRGTSLSPEQVNYVQAIDNSARMMLSMVNELLETARAEATGALDTHTPAARHPFDPARMVEEVCELLAPRAHGRGLQLACFVHPQVHGQWLGDEPRLRQILLNLLGNALKFTREGGVVVRLLPAEGGVMFSVADSGPGVPEELESSIFRPFTRAAAHDVAREGGVGLGLAIVRQLLDMMGGRLTLDNRPGEGATFNVFVPLKPLQARRQEAPAPLQGVQVVLVLADALHHSVLSDYITALGGMVETAMPEALPELAGQEGLDIIVDAAHAPALRAALAAMPKARLWLLLTPEERLAMHEVMQHPRLAGWLLKPLRRQTIVERLAHGGAEALLNASVKTLRGMVRRARVQHADAPDGASVKAKAEPLVLLAEDDPVNAQVSGIVLRRAGCRVVHHENGQALLEDVRRRLLGDGERPLCVLMDVHMPGMDGIEAAQAIRQMEHDLHPHGPRLPLIALSAGDEGMERERCLAAGMDGFLSKPLEPEQLQMLLDALRTTSGEDGGADTALPSSSAARTMLH